MTAVALFLIGRILFGVFFLASGLHHFADVHNMSAYARSKGTPAPWLAVIATGVLLITGGASILLGAYPILGIVLLGVFLVGVSFVMHAFWALRDPQQRAAEKVHFLKNMALLGALLMFLLIPVPWPLSLHFGLPVP